MTQNQAVAQFAIALPQPNLPQQLGQANQFTAIPENDRAIALSAKFFYPICELIQTEKITLSISSQISSRK